MSWVWGKGSGFRAQPSSLIGEPQQGKCLCSGEGPGTLTSLERPFSPLEPRQSILLAQ